ncbi:hypothetical protein GCM10025876_19750 [Demequina litorisediminis]|uniref:Uncharacterized protein n=1 Tax=Demequina litorisediminis TaxID=1849022 RepID=A0ABQ6IDN5_9MICO|nr:DUF6049 family protein [Demequina litorisediminis]GMA35771.1 hypothetical protein GCM10025876_19750 [Demequina litorisediminis]
MTVRNSGSEPIEGVQLSMSLTREPLTSTDAVAAFLEDPTGVDAREVALTPEEEPAEEDATTDSTEDAEEAPVGETLAAGGAKVMSISADDEALDLPADAWGVYGISLALETPEGSVEVGAAVTTWVDSEVPNLDVAVLAVADGTAEDVAATLDATALDGVAVATDPTALTNALVFDNDLLEREVVRLPSGDPDLTSLAHGDGASILDLAVTEPSGSSILSTGKMPLIAPVQVLDDETLALAQDAGAIAALASRDTVGVEDLGSSLTLAEGSDLPIVSPDPVLSEIVAGGATNPAVDGALVAASALTEGGAALVTLDADGAVTPAGARLVETLLGSPWVTPVSMADLAASAADLDTSVDLPGTRDTENDLPADDVATLTSRLSSLTTLASVTDNPAAAVQEWGAGLVAGVRAAGRNAQALRESSLATALEGAEATLMGVAIAEGSDLNLLADSGDIPITVVNSLDKDVTVTVRLVSNSPNLVVEDSPEITVRGGQEATALVPVSAVSTANVTVVVGLETAEGDQACPVADLRHPRARGLGHRRRRDLHRLAGAPDGRGRHSHHSSRPHRHSPWPIAHSGGAAHRRRRPHRGG